MATRTFDFENFGSFFNRTMLESSEKWTEWAQEIPSLSFKPDWKVKIIPPYGGAMARFVVSRGSTYVSVYLDVNDSLGVCGYPYWEIYPYKGEAFRCSIDEVDELIEAIDLSLGNKRVKLKSRQNG